MRALRAYAADDTEGMESVARELESARAITVAIAFADVALYSGNLRGAVSLARRFLEVARSPELRALCHIQLAHLAVARGEAASAAEEVALAEGFDPAWGLETRGLLATLPFAGTSERELEALRAQGLGCSEGTAEWISDLRDAQRPAFDYQRVSAGSGQRPPGGVCPRSRRMPRR